MHRRKSYFQSRLALSAASIAATASIAAAQPVSYDFNDDGYTDFPVAIISYDQTTPDVGAARIWSGASKSILQTIVSTDTNTLFGWSTGSAGDLDGDGKDDLIVGEPFWSAAANYEGRIQVFSGADASVLLTISGPYVDTGLGRYVTGVGDWNGDGTIDIASSGWDIADTDNDGVGDDAIGVVFVFSGVDGSVLAEFLDPTSTQGFGYSVFGLGDITGDGNADIAILDQAVEPVADSGIYGEIYIFAGSATAGAFDITDAHSVISNVDENVRSFGAQIDIMHPDLWLDQPTLQIISLTYGESGGVNEAEIMIDIMKTDGVITGTKGNRPTLKLAGDVNLDGKVDTLDIQDSISQLGTDPQAIGVMPIVDSNNDNIIDAQDIQVVMDGYGQTTDIYEGLWDGTRLLSIAGGDVGFGSTSGFGITPGGGGTGFGGRPRPSDGCLHITYPPDMPNITILPSLLREDAGKNCDECPDYGAAGSAGCYECDQPGTLSGGGISADPPQPEADEPVRFIIDDVILAGKTLKCKEECGGEKTHSVDPGPYPFSWDVFRKVDNDADWVLIDSGSGSPTPYYSGAACSKLKIEMTAGGGSGDCVPEEIMKEKEVAFGDFTLTSRMSLNWPSPRSRTNAGPHERVVVAVNPLGVSVEWEFSWEETKTPNIDGYFVDLPGEPGVYTVTVTSNECVQTITFTVKAPTGVRVENVGYKNLPGWADAGQCLKFYVLPESVNFAHIQIGEGFAPANVSAPPDGYTEHSMAYYNGIDHAVGPMRGVEESLNRSVGLDRSYKFARLVEIEWVDPVVDQAGNEITPGYWIEEYVPGNMSWSIKLLWKTSTVPITEMAGSILSTGSVDANGTVTIQKGNASVIRNADANPEECAN